MGRLQLFVICVLWVNKCELSVHTVIISFLYTCIQKRIATLRMDVNVYFGRADGTK